jgi:hypothetical protein
VYTAQASRRCHQHEDSRHDEAITIARTINLKLYVIVIINSVVTNDDAINISEVNENMNMTISVTTAATFKRSHINSPAQSDPTVITTYITPSHLCSSLEDIRSQLQRLRRLIRTSSLSSS